MGKKYKYAVSISAEEETNGFIELTKEQAAIVKYATNINNWDIIENNPYSGFFFIDTDYPNEMTKEMEEFLTNNNSYKDFTLIKASDGILLLKDLFEEELKTDNEPLVQIYQIEPIKDNNGKIIDIMGLVGKFTWKNDKIISLDDNAYSPEMIVYGYRRFNTGLDILVGENY